MNITTSMIYLNHCSQIRNEVKGRLEKWLWLSSLPSNVPTLIVPQPTTMVLPTHGFRVPNNNINLTYPKPKVAH